MSRGEVTSRDLKVTNRNLPHWQIGGSWYFITFRTTGSHLNEEARYSVVSSILRFNKIKYELSAAVVMPDHVHMLLTAILKQRETYFSLGEILGSVKGASARRINSLMGKKGKVWQEEWFDRIVRDEKEWLEKCNYIMNNAVKAGLVLRPQDYKWLLIGESLTNHY